MTQAQSGDRPHHLIIKFLAAGDAAGCFAVILDIDKPREQSPGQAFSSFDRAPNTCSACLSSDLERCTKGYALSA